jgi:hypothetical protein
MTVANFWRGSLYLLFCKYRDKNLRPGSHPALPAWVGEREKISAKYQTDYKPI